MANMVTVLMPNGEQAGDLRSQLAPRVDGLRGKTVGIVNNSWQCMHVIADEYRALLTKDYGVREVIEKRIAAIQNLAPEELADLATRCDAVIVGIGN